MTSYEVSVIKERTDYSFALKSIHEEINEANDGNGDRGKIINLAYDHIRVCLLFQLKQE